MTDMQDNSTPEEGLDNAARRRFVNGVAALATGLPAGFALTSVANARPVDEAVTDAVRWGMLIDTTKCSKGCSACVDACNEENGLGNETNSSAEQSSQWIRKVELKHKVTGSAHALPLACQHCENPPCVDVCPTGASFQRVDGIVLVDRHICIGCRYCMMACPYKARSFVHESLTDQKPHTPRGKGCVESCTFCVHRVDAGETPACVEACEGDGHKAMIFGDLKDPESAVSKAIAESATTQIRSDLGTNPGVFFRGLPS